MNDFCSSINGASYRKYYRVVPRKNIDYTEIIDNFWGENGLSFSKDKIKKIMDISEKDRLGMRLSQLGVQNKGNEDKILKAYFSLRKFCDENDICGEKQCFEMVNEMIKQIYRLCDCSEKLYNDISNMAKEIECYEYFPSMLGINQFQNDLECKVYFELFTPDKYFPSIDRTSAELLRYICNYRNWSEEVMLNTNKFFLEENYFMRGIAVSNTNYGIENVVRLYFAPKQRFA